MKNRLNSLALAAAIVAVTLSPAAVFGQQGRKITSRLEIYDVASGTRTVLKEYPYSIEAPNWTVDGTSLVYNSGGKLFRIDVAAPERDVQIPTGDAHPNNDHVLSADGRGLAISASSTERPGSYIYTLPLAGGEPRLITPESPSYLHGWSPDGSTLTYTARRNDDFDIYTIPAAGGPERRLTTAATLDDGPEYSPDGRHIWFNSVRTGLMQVWRMRADGSEQTQITFDEGRNSWFPHVSPDGRWMLYIAYAKGDVNPADHPAGKNVELRLMPLKGKNRSRTVTADGSGAETVARLFGGQGTINVNSWSPDSRRLAFVSYEYSE